MTLIEIIENELHDASVELMDLSDPHDQRTIALRIESEIKELLKDL